jgi:segregation and condensation protein A
MRPVAARLCRPRLRSRSPQRRRASDFPFAIELGEIYEGPLDLLLDLIRKQDIDIYDIPIAKITAQYLAYVEKHPRTRRERRRRFHLHGGGADSHQVEDAAAARSARSRRRAGRSPRNELVNRLLEHEKFKSAAQMLLQKQQIEDAVLSNPR